MSRLIALTTALIALLYAPSALGDDEGGSFLKSYGHAGLFIESGERGDRAGKGVIAFGEFMVDDLITQLGHHAGIEGNFEVGWADYSNEIDDFSFGAQGPMHMELALGFPIALMEFGRGSPWGIRLQVAPGAGLGITHAYGYLRGRLTLRIADNYGFDVNYKWTPSRASYAWEDRTGLSTGTLRVAFHAALDPISVLVFAELAQAKTEVIAIGPLHPVERAPYQNLVRIGAGWVF